MKYLKDFKKACISLLLVFLLISACNKKDTSAQSSTPTTTPTIASYTDLNDLPKDLGGVQTPVLLNNTNNTSYGYYVYTPSGYQNNNSSYPLLVFLHGTGEMGNSMTTPSELTRVLTYGPPALINKKMWSPKYPMIVVSPQCSQTDKIFQPDVLNEFIKSIISKYRINTHRIYLTGLSFGGGATWNYLITYSDKGYVAAAAPIASGGAFKTNLENIPIWAFCGESDATNFSKIKATVAELNQNSSTSAARLTAFAGVGHNCWDISYSGSGMGKEDKSFNAFDMSIYDWMFQYAK